ncbi:MAG: class I SAM-dependent methyltransferase [Flexilinea sp.]
MENQNLTGENLKNPWEEIKLTDYENHMKLDSVMQLQTMNAMMKEQFYQYPTKTIMILGIAGGNGLEHINPEIIEKVFGIDINREYLDECANRYAQLNGVLSLICTDLTEDNIVLPYTDLVIANLFIEYVGYACFQQIVNQVKPLYVSCVIQINTDTSFVSDSSYIHAFDHLDTVHHQISEKTLVEAMESIGYHMVLKNEALLPNGKKLVRLDFKR